MERDIGTARRTVSLFCEASWGFRVGALYIRIRINLGKNFALSPAPSAFYSCLSPHMKGTTPILSFSESRVKSAHKSQLLSDFWSCALDVLEYRWQSHCEDMVLIQPPYWISGSIKGPTLKITNIHTTKNDHSCPLIHTSGITPWFKCFLKRRYINPYGRSSKSMRCFPRNLPGSGSWQPKIDIEVRFFMRD